MIINLCMIKNLFMFIIICYFTNNFIINYKTNNMIQQIFAQKDISLTIKCKKYYTMNITVVQKKSSRKLLSSRRI